MMSPTTSLGSPFSAESCARPVTSSRFIAGAPPLLQLALGDKKSGVDPLSAAPAAPGHRPEAVDEIVSKRGNLGGSGRRPLSYVRLFPIIENSFVSWFLRKIIAMMIAIAITAMMSAYSTKPCPDSSLMNRPIPAPYRRVGGQR